VTANVRQRLRHHRPKSLRPRVGERTRATTERLAGRDRLSARPGRALLGHRASPQRGRDAAASRGRTRRPSVVRPPRARYQPGRAGALPWPASPRLRARAGGRARCDRGGSRTPRGPHRRDDRVRQVVVPPGTEGRGAAGWGYDPEHHPQGGRLAGAVGPKERRHAPRRDHRADVIDCPNVSEGLGERGQLDGRRHRRPPLSRHRISRCSGRREFGKTWLSLPAITRRALVLMRVPAVGRRRLGSRRGRDRYRGRSPWREGRGRRRRPCRAGPSGMGDRRP
jgi:hypothetical protein